MAKKLYRLQDGTQADPSDVSRGKDGVLRHKSGLAVCIDANGEPETIAVGKAESSPEEHPLSKPEDRSRVEDRPAIQSEPKPE